MRKKKKEEQRRKKNKKKRRNEDGGVAMNAWSEHGGWERERKKMRKWNKVVDEVAMGGKEWDKRED